MFPALQPGQVVYDPTFIHYFDCNCTEGHTLQPVDGSNTTAMICVDVALQQSLHHHLVLVGVLPSVLPWLFVGISIWLILRYVSCSHKGTSIGVAGIGLAAVHVSNNLRTEC